MSKATIRPVLAGLIFGIWALGAAAPAAAVEPVNTNRGLSAIAGYDPVAYFTKGGPLRGSNKITAEWNGATWRFVNAEHRDKFVADPARYAPKYGGYCAWAMSQGQASAIDPKVWRIIEGRLYLNYSVSIMKRWEGDLDRNITAGDRNWPEILKQ